ncbi:MAG TPA: peptidoglycan bridge formation glycyltransferase FemA/FemB family protein [Candidatus Limnocylindria bacterium]|nr:peptidoglycan bridge formation glycyltransferase FemA/FemB family protein [Candidatus Limnocylindria bacterium]
MTAAPEGWDAAAARGPDGHVMQSSAWASIRERQGWTAEFLRPAGAHALVLWRPLPGGLRFGYCPRGPVASPAQLPEALRALAARARETKGALVLKVDPERTADECGAALNAAGFVAGPDIQPVVATLVLGLDKDPDALLAGFEKDTRWSVRQPEKRGVELYQGTTDEDLGAFYDLYALTGRRAGFITRTEAYYRTVWRTLIDAGLATLWLAAHGDRPVAGAMTWHCGDREVYQYGATNDAGRKVYAAYGLLWRCIGEAQARGARAFDFGGIPADPDDVNDPMHGPYRFKKGFGGTVTHWVGAHDAVPRPLAYRAFRLLEPAYTKALQLTRGRGGGE